MALRSIWLAALLGLASACGPKEVPYAVSVITTSCDTAVNPFQGVEYLQVRVTGTGITSPLVSTAIRDAKRISIPSIPSGAKRVIEVRGYDGDPAAGGKIVSVGASPPFDVPDLVPDLAGGAYGINVFLRKIGVFSPVVSASNPTQCVRMRVARAGHAATLLDSGKVLITGGYNLASGSRVALSDVEIFNPFNNTFGAGPELSIRSTSGESKFPRAFHTATKLPNGQVVIWGGESYATVNNVEVVAPSPNVLTFDEPRFDKSTDAYIPPRRDDQPISRSRHAAAVDQNGNLLIVGGVTRNASNLVPADRLEAFIGDTKSADFNKSFNVATPASFIRLDAVVSPIKKGEFIVVAGGVAGATSSELRTDVSFFKFDPAAKTFVQQMLSAAPRLADPGRRAAGVALLRDGVEVAMLGGYSDALQVRPVATSEILSSATSTVTVGPNVGPRGQVCAVTLPNGSILVIGGRTTEMVSGMTKTRSDATTTLVTPSGAGGATSLPGPALNTGRYSHTCTLLTDGSVLVLGGLLEDTGGTLQVLQDAWVYQPAPVDP